MENSPHLLQLINLLHLIRQRKENEYALFYSHIRMLLSTLHLVMRLKLDESKLAQQAVKKPLIDFLIALQKAREDLVNRSINEDPQLYSCLFQFENNDNLLSLCFDREYSMFLNKNLECIANQFTGVKDSYTQKKLKIVTEEFIKVRYFKSTSGLTAFFLDDKIKEIGMIFSVFDKDKDRIKEINYIRKKEQVLFDRLFKKLTGE